MTTSLPSAPEEGVNPAAGHEQASVSGFQRILKWAERGVLIATVAGLISSTLFFFVAARGLDLVVWFEKVQRVYPSADTGDIALPLAFHNEPARAVSLIKVNVSNLGDSAIGSQEHLWQLTISDPKVSDLQLVANPERSSKRIQVMEVAQSTRNAYSVQLGILERREHVDFWLMAIHDPAVRVRPEVSTSLAGLPTPETTSQPLYARLGEKLAPFVIPLSALGFLYIAVQDLRDRSAHFRKAMDVLKELREQRKEQDQQLKEGKEVPEDQRVSDDLLKVADDRERTLQATYWRRSRWAMARAYAGNGAAIVFGAGVFGTIAANILGWIMAWFI